MIISSLSIYVTAMEEKRAGMQTVSLVTTAVTAYMHATAFTVSSILSFCMYFDFRTCAIPP